MLPTGVLPSLWRNVHRTHAKRPADTPREVRGSRGRQSAAQKSSVADRHTTGQLYASMRFTLSEASLANGKTSSLTRLVRVVCPGDRCHIIPGVSGLTWWV